MSEAMVLERQVLIPIDDRSYVRWSGHVDRGLQRGALQTIDLDQLELVAGGASWSEWGQWAGGILGGAAGGYLGGAYGGTLGGGAGFILGTPFGPGGQFAGTVLGTFLGGRYGASVGSS